MRRLRTILPVLLVAFFGLSAIALTVLIKSRTGPNHTAANLPHSAAAASPSPAVMFDASPSPSATSTATASGAATASGSAVVAPPASTGSSSAGASVPPARAWASMAYDPTRDVTLLFGGLATSGYPYLGDTWAWNGTRWTALHPSSSPSARDGAAMAADTARQRIVLFGGSGGTPAGDTWTWDGSTWTLEQPATSPPARSDAVMGYDSDRALIILFGGIGAGGTTLTDTWSWNGHSWTQVATASSPTGRQGGVMGYDAAGKRMILVGSAAGDSAGLIPWAFNGSAWTALQPATADRPGQHYGAFFGAMGTTGTITVFGGLTYPGQPVQTWEWNGTRWVLMVPATSSPPVRGGGMQPATPMAYDSHRHELVMFSGQGPTGWLDDTWTWDGTIWTRRN